MLVVFSPLFRALGTVKHNARHSFSNVHKKDLGLHFRRILFTVICIAYIYIHIIFNRYLLLFAKFVTYYNTGTYSLTLLFQNITSCSCLFYRKESQSYFIPRHLLIKFILERIFCAVTLLFVA